MEDKKHTKEDYLLTLETWPLPDTGGIKYYVYYGTKEQPHKKLIIKGDYIGPNLGSVVTNMISGLALDKFDKMKKNGELEGIETKLD